MSVKASLLRRAALTLVAGAAISLPLGAQAQLLHNLSIRAGAFFPSSGDLRDITNVAAFGGGIDYKLGFIPKLLNGESWSSSVSADMYYASRKSGGLVRYLTAAVNQVYTFEEQHGHTPYAGFSVLAAVVGGHSNDIDEDRVGRSFTDGGRQPTVTRFGGGLIVGLNVTKSLYWEARYDWVDRHGLDVSLDGFRTSIGWRF